MSLYLSQAIGQMLEQQGVPIITEYTLYQQVRPLLETGELRGQKIIRLPAYWGQAQLRAMVRTLEKRKVLAPDEDFNAGVWRVVQAATAPTADEAVCLVDPFAYISHLSAMQRYGLTDRSPESLHVTTPARSLWTQFRDAKMNQDYQQVLHRATVPQLIRIGLKDEVRRRHVAIHQSINPAEPVPIAGTVSRIAAIGRVFADMLDKPELCGGIHHVLEGFNRHAEPWLDEIIAEIDIFDSPIVKVRAGYILDELLGISRPTIEGWTSCAQRGGSRKLDPKAPYGSTFSEKWMIALNV